MNFKPINIFGFVMSFAYVFFGLLILMTPFLSEMISDPMYRKIMGGALMGYGLFRVMYFFRKLREKS